MIWNPFKKKTIDPERNIVEELTNDLQDNNQIDKLEVRLLGIKNKPLNEKEIEAWHHLFGICAFQRGEHDLASDRFTKGLSVCPESSQIRFSLAQEFIFLGQPEKAFPLFDKCLFPAISREFTLAMSRYAYLFSEHERGIKYLNKFFDIYKEVKILDDHFLYVRGLPFFGTAWSHLAAHCILSDNIKTLTSITSEISNCCQDYDFEFLKIELEAVVNNDFNQMIEALHSRQDEIRKQNGATSFNDLKISIFESFSSHTLKEALDKISSVDLSSNDFQWLEDIKILAKAEAAHRFKDDSESEFVGAFLQNQSMLFEPDHALAFGLLAYQETIKQKVDIVTASNKR